MNGDGCSYAVALNPNDSQCTEIVRCARKACAYDVFAKHSMGECSDSIESTIPPHSARLIKFISGE